MATSNPNQNSITDEYIRDLLECPVCMETIKSVPVYQCTNGHVICKDCIEKLNKCPICRNNSGLNRNLKLENIVQRLEGIQPESSGPINVKPNLQKWGKGFVRSYGTINGNNQDEEASILRRQRQENNERTQFFANLFCFLFSIFIFLLLFGYILYETCELNGHC
jgi:hypothetical protein